MNFQDISAFWLSLVFSGVFLLAMAFRIVKSLFIDDIALKGLIINLDNIRYTTMFLSFLLTQYFGILGGQKWLAGYELTALQSAVAYGVVMIAGVTVSALISTLLVQSERAMGEGNLTLPRWIAVMLIYAITAGIDFGTIYGGFVLVGQELYARAEKRIEKRVQASDDAVVAKQYQNLYADKREEVKRLEARIASVQNGAWVDSWNADKQIAKIDKDIAWCKVKRWKHNTLDAKRNARAKILRAKTLQKLHEEKQRLEAQAVALLERFEKTKDTRDAKGDVQLQKAAQHKHMLKVLGAVFGLGLVVFNFVTSFIRGVLSDRKPQLAQTDTLWSDTIGKVKTESIALEEKPKPMQSAPPEALHEERDKDTEIFSFLAQNARKGKTLPGYREIVDALNVRNDDVSNFYKNYPHYYVQEGKKKYPSDALLDAIEQSA